MELVRTKIFNCGEEHKEVEIFFVPPASCGRKRPRERTGNPTDERKKETNSKNSEKKLRRLLKTNFASGRDFYVTLTFNDEHLPSTYEEATTVISKFFRNLRLACDRRNIEAKWIYVIEIGKNGRLHVHTFINAAVNRELILCHWSMGYVRFKKISNDAVQIARVAKYSLKAPQGKHGWHASRSIEQPEVETDDKLISHGLFASVAYSGFNHGDVAELVQRLFPDYLMKDYYQYYCAELMTPFLCVILQKQKAKARRDEIDFAELFGCSQAVRQQLASDGWQWMNAYDNSKRRLSFALQ